MIFFQALAQKPYHFIAIMARSNGMGVDTSISKEELISRAATTLTDPDAIRERLGGLSPPQREALRDLFVAGGRLPLHHLTGRHGQVRSSRAIINAWRQGETLSPLEQLCLLGLAFHDRPAGELFIPTDFIAYVSVLEPPPPPLAEPPPADPETAFDHLCHDLTGLLALLQREPVKLTRGRWLPPWFLKRWAAYCITPPQVTTPRSELQTGRRRFIHYLAESAGLVTAGPGDAGRRRPWYRGGVEAPDTPIDPPESDRPQLNDRQPLALTPAAWQWLNATRQERFEILWQAWSGPDRDRWRRYRLPGFTWQQAPAALLEPLHQALPQWPVADPQRFARRLLAQQPHLLNLLPANSVKRQQRLTTTITALLNGPLLWLGITAEPSEQASPAVPTLYLHALGQAWLAGQSLPPLPYTPFTITTVYDDAPLAGRLELSLPGGLPRPAVQMSLVELDANRQPDRSPQSYLLTAPAIIGAVQQGWSPAALRHSLETAVGGPLPGHAMVLLRRWAGLAGQVKLRPAWLLETSRPAVISRLASSRRGRPLIRRTLSSRVVEVNPAQMELLVKRLAEQEGVPPQVESGCVHKVPLHRRKALFARLPQFHPALSLILVETGNAVRLRRQYDLSAAWSEPTADYQAQCHNSWPLFP
jgi:hypothetical protein